MNLDAFWARVDASGGRGACWEWLGPLGSSGYGRAWIDGSSRDAHRVACESLHGPLLPGQVARHRCVERSTRRIPGGALAERRCCNPWHLDPGSQRENAADRSRAGRSGRRLDGRPAGRRYW